MLSFWYNAPLFILCAIWLLLRKDMWRRRQWLRSTVDLLVLLLGLVRFLGAAILPSGHALFLTHTLITVGNLIYRIFALLMLLVVIALKISWGDYESWTAGIIVGLISGLLWVKADKIFPDRK